MVTDGSLEFPGPGPTTAFSLIGGPMRTRALRPALLLLVACAPGDTADLREVAVDPDLPLGASITPATAPSSLQRAVAAAGDSTRLVLAPGHYVLQPSAYTDPTCGNCQDPATPVPATVGMVLSGARIELRGGSADSVFIHTGAGYGVLVEDCEDCAIRGVTITGGTRDPDGQATDGGVVVRRSAFVLEDCAIRDNIGDSATVAATVVGIAGVVGREEALLAVRRCRIVRNSWDGIALYRGARAEIMDNVVDGVDAAAGGAVGGGRGVGIGLTWDAQAEVMGNLVTRYWKGIGVFVDARGSIRHNVVEEVLTWGIALWGAGEGRAVGRIRDNAIYRTGACGAMIARGPAGEEDPGTFSTNAVVETGRNERYDSGEPYCPQRPIARSEVPERFGIAGNMLHGNRQPGDQWPVEGELDAAAFQSAVGPLVTALLARTALAGSAFLARYR